MSVLNKTSCFHYSIIRNDEEINLEVSGNASITQRSRFNYSDYPEERSYDIVSAIGKCGSDWSDDLTEEEIGAIGDILLQKVRDEYGC